MKNDIKNNKTIILLGCSVIFLFVLSMFCAYKVEWSSAMNQPWSAHTVKDAISSSDNIEDVFVLEEGVVVSQDVQMVTDEISGIAVNVNLADADPEGTIKVSLYNDTESTLINQWEYNLSQGQFDGFMNLYLDSPYVVDKDDIYTISVEGVGFEEEFPSVLHADIFPIELQELAEVNEQEQETLFSYKVLDGGSHALKYFFCMIVFLCVLCMAVLVYMLMKKKSLAWIAVVVILLIGTVYLFILPPFVVPDEGSHFVAAYNGSNILLGKEAYDEEGRVIGDETAALYLIREEYPTKDTYIRYMKGVFGRTDAVDDEIVMRTSLSLQHPGYIPQILGLSLARLLGMNAEQVTLMGRLFALFFYSFMMYWSIKLIPHWKTTMFVIGILPMTLQQVVSYNYDSVLFAICFFAISYILYLKYEKRTIQWRDYLILALCAISVATIKFVYLLIFGLAILIPKEKFGSMIKKIGAAASIVAVSGASIVFTRMAMLEKAVSADSVYQDTEGLVRYSLQACLADPINTIVLFYRTMEIRVSEYLVSMVATPLGWVDISLPHIVAIALIILLIFSVMTENDKVNMKRWEKGVLGLSSLGVVFLTLLALLIDYTYVGSKYILGVQGRYFLPVLPIFLLLLQSKELVLKSKLNKYLLIAAVSVQLYAVWSITLTVVSR